MLLRIVLVQTIRSWDVSGGKYCQRANSVAKPDQGTVPSGFVLLQELAR